MCAGFKRESWKENKNKEKEIIMEIEQDEFEFCENIDSGGENWILVPAWKLAVEYKINWEYQIPLDCNIDNLLRVQTSEAELKRVGYKQFRKAPYKNPASQYSNQSVRMIPTVRKMRIGKAKTNNVIQYIHMEW